jgi:hypothetical protein
VQIARLVLRNEGQEGKYLQVMGQRITTMRPTEILGRHQTIEPRPRIAYRMTVQLTFIFDSPSSAVRPIRWETTGVD